MVTHADWPIRNSQRRYPIDDGASITGNDGTVLPEGLLIDASIWAPKYEYSTGRYLQYIWVSSIMVSEHLVSLTLLGCVDPLSSPEAEFVPIGSISLPRPIDTYRNYAIEPLLDGVMGWVSFGHVAASDTPVSLSFSNPSQAMLAPKAARFYAYLPITSAKPYDSSSTVTGDVRIVAQEPVVAEIKDMRVSGETSDRTMLVLGLAQTEDILSGFAGLCGKRPESGNCMKSPITTIAGITPDCNGNINISFDAEIIVRYFSNPLYPTLDPTYPIRGGMCLDSVFSLDQACQKVQTLPDDAGLLPGEYTWVRPCDLVVPYSTIFSDEDSFKQVVILSGYAYIQEYSLYVSAGMNTSAELAPCFPTLTLVDDTDTVRSHKVTFSDTPKGCVVGMFAFDTINTRLLFKVERGNAPAGSEAGLWSLSEFSKALDVDLNVLAAGTWGDTEINSIIVIAKSDRTLIIKANSDVIAAVTLDTDDVYYDPMGKAGIYVGGANMLSFEPRPSVVVAQYDVTDTEL